MGRRVRAATRATAANPNRRPLRRAARWDGLFPVDVPDPEAFATLRREVEELRGADAGPFDLVAEIEEPGADPGPWAEAGATWVLTAFGLQPRADAVREAIEAGPG